MLRNVKIVSSMMSGDYCHGKESPKQATGLQNARKKNFDRLTLLI